MEEQVVCFKKEILTKYLNQTKVFYDEKLWNRILDSFEFLPRANAEHNYNFKQLIAYVVIKSQNLYLAYRRTRKTNERRLRLEYSIGIGGHVNISDTTQLSIFDHESKRDLILQAALREVHEEITISSNIIETPQLICFINDDSNDVGKVHFGTVWLLEINEPNVSPSGEKGMGKFKFYNLANLVNKKESFENWSQLLIEYLTTRR